MDYLDQRSILTRGRYSIASWMRGRANPTAQSRIGVGERGTPMEDSSHEPSKPNRPVVERPRIKYENHEWPYQVPEVREWGYL